MFLLLLLRVKWIHKIPNPCTNSRQSHLSTERILVNVRFKESTLSCSAKSQFCVKLKSSFPKPETTFGSPGHFRCVRARREARAEPQIGRRPARGSQRSGAVSARSNSPSPYLEALAPPSRRKLQQNHFRPHFENKAKSGANSGPSPLLFIYYIKMSVREFYVVTR